MATINIFTEQFTGRLKRAVAEHLDWYKAEESVAEDFAAGTKWDLATNVELRLPAGTKAKNLLLLPSNDSLSDLDNSVRLHRSLASLTHVQARDPRLWTRLTHVEFWPYMRARWPVERHIENQPRAKRYIEERYFVPRTEGRALLRNGIARLWWYAQLTYDDTRSNPYELTGVLLSSLDITQQILERSIGRCRSVLVAFLEFLLQNPRLLEGGDFNREVIRSLAKSLNLFGGVAVLDTLAPSLLKTYLNLELTRIDAREANG